MPAADRSSLWRESLRIGLLLGLLTIVFAYPLSVRPASTVLPLKSDTNLYLWTLQWDVHQLTHEPLSVFDANIYFPFRHTLAFSENLIGSAVLAAPILWLTHNAVLAMNLVALLSCPLCGVGAYVLARRVGCSVLASTIAAVIFAFAPPRFFRLGQLHLTTVQWMPFCLACVHAYLDSRRRRDLWWACAFFALQVVTSAHGTLFLTLAVVGLLVWRTVLGDAVFSRAVIRDAALPCMLTLMIVAALYLPYREVQRETSLRRSFEEVSSFSPTPASLLASPGYLDRVILASAVGDVVLRDATAFLFPGVLTLALAATAVWPRKVQVPWIALLEVSIVASAIAAAVLTVTGGARVKYGSAIVLSVRRPFRVWLVCAALVVLRVALARRIPLDLANRVRTAAAGYRRWSRANRTNPVPYYALLVLVSFWLALGTPYGLYALVYDWPGFTFIRVPSRFSILSLLGLAVLAAAGFDRLLASRSNRTRLTLTTIAMLVLAAEFIAAPLNTIPYGVDIPAVDRWLAQQPKPFVVAEVPLASPHDILGWTGRQSVYMLHSTAHWQKTIHGYSGMQPPFHDQLYAELTRFPNEDIIVRLASLGVSYIVVHTDLYPIDQRAVVTDRLGRLGELFQLVYADASGRVYAVRPARLESAR